jgi:hypothetical protein
MSSRPCNPGSDFKGLWQVFLRDMPIPQCQTPSDSQPAEGSKAATSDPNPDKPEADTTRER